VVVRLEAIYAQDDKRNHEDEAEDDANLLIVVTLGLDVSESEETYV
jgi:hypothetical protein